MPNVPNDPGVPPLNSYSTGSLVLLTADSAGIGLGSNASQWGIFDQFGNPVIVGDNVKAFEYDEESRVADFPVEQGAFASYNKVVVPYNAVVTFTKGGTVAERTAFLNSVSAAKASLELLTVVTPEIQYQNANVVRDVIEQRTARNGVTLLTVAVYCREIRPAPAPAFTNTKSPTSQGQVNDGTVQPVTPSPSQVSLANGFQ